MPDLSSAQAAAFIESVFFSSECGKRYARAVFNDKGFRSHDVIESKRFAERVVNTYVSINFIGIQKCKLAVFIFYQLGFSDFAALSVIESERLIQADSSVLGKKERIFRHFG